MDKENPLFSSQDDLRDPGAGPPFYHGVLATKDAEALVLTSGSSTADGVFLVRQDPSQAGAAATYMLTVTYKGRATHHVVENEGGDGFAVNKKRSEFQGLPELIEHLGQRRKALMWPVPLATPINAPRAAAAAPPPPEFTPAQPAVDTAPAGGAGPAQPPSGGAASAARTTGPVFTKAAPFVPKPFVPKARPAAFVMPEGFVAPAGVSQRVLERLGREEETRRQRAAEARAEGEKIKVQSSAWLNEQKKRAGASAAVTKQAKNAEEAKVQQQKQEEINQKKAQMAASRQLAKEQAAKRRQQESQSEEDEVRGLPTLVATLALWGCGQSVRWHALWYFARTRARHAPKCAAAAAAALAQRTAFTLPHRSVHHWRRGAQAGILTEPGALCVRRMPCGVAVSAPDGATTGQGGRNARLDENFVCCSKGSSRGQTARARRTKTDHAPAVSRQRHGGGWPASRRRQGNCG